jgi:hypothetical protein
MEENAGGWVKSGKERKDPRDSTENERNGWLGATMSQAGLTNSVHFTEIYQNSTDSVWSEFKNRRITVHE